MKGPVVATILAVMACGAVAHAEDGPFEMRVRAVDIDPANGSDAVPGLAIPTDAIRVNNKVIPEIDLEYYFTPHWSTELILTYPQNQTVTVQKSALGGPTDIGSFRHLPPVLTVKYGFFPDAPIRPYIGVGVNITYIYDVRLSVPTVGNLDLSNWSVGPAIQVGADWQLSKHWYINTDIKWAMLRANITLNDQHVSQAQLDPFLFGLGVGYRFGGN